MNPILVLQHLRVTLISRLIDSNVETEGSGVFYVLWQMDLASEPPSLELSLVFEEVRTNKD